MAAPNIVNVSTITGKTAVANVSTDATAIVENGSSSGKVIKINTLIISNIDGTSAADITVDLYRSSIATHIAKTISVDADTAFTPLDKSSVIYLEEGDALRVTASANGDLQAVCSYEEIS